MICNSGSAALAWAQRQQKTGAVWVMKALNRHVERVFNPERKDHHWGKRKLKRDQ
jgi:hypothetical protein